MTSSKAWSQALAAALDQPAPRRRLSISTNAALKLARSYALAPKDLANFKAVFVEMLGQRLGAGWSSAAAKAWDQAFDEVIIPLMREGGAG